MVQLRKIGVLYNPTQLRKVGATWSAYLVYALHIQARS